MPVRLVFRCQFCGEEPDPDTARSLAAQLQEIRFGEYVNAEPGFWLAWHGRGPYGPSRHACPKHRVELPSYLRKHYGSIGWHPHAKVLGDLPPEVRSDLSPLPPSGRRATARQRRLLRGGPGFPGLA
jgi:hypothetical protein